MRWIALRDGHQVENLPTFGYWQVLISDPGRTFKKTVKCLSHSTQLILLMQTLVCLPNSSESFRLIKIHSKSGVDQTTAWRQSEKVALMTREDKWILRGSRSFCETWHFLHDSSLASVSLALCNIGYLSDFCCDLCVTTLDLWWFGMSHYEPYRLELRDLTHRQQWSFFGPLGIVHR